MSSRNNVMKLISLVVLCYVSSSIVNQMYSWTLWLFRNLQFNIPFLLSITGLNNCTNNIFYLQYEIVGLSFYEDMFRKPPISKWEVTSYHVWTYTLNKRNYFMLRRLVVMLESLIVDWMLIRLRNMKLDIWCSPLLGVRWEVFNSSLWNGKDPN